MASAIYKTLRCGFDTRNLCAEQPGQLRRKDVEKTLPNCRCHACVRALRSRASAAKVLSKCPVSTSTQTASRRQHDKDRARAHVEKMRARGHLSIYDIIGVGAFSSRGRCDSDSLPLSWERIPSQFFLLSSCAEACSVASKSTRTIHHSLTLYVSALLCLLRLQRGDPLYPVRILGTKCKVHESDQHYHNTEREVNLVKWNGRDDTTIDRFDGAARPPTGDPCHPRPTPCPPRHPNPTNATPHPPAVRMTMDFIREPIEGRPRPPLSDELQHEEDQCNYERYRDLVRLVRKGLTEDEKGLEYVEKEEIDRRALVDGHNAPTAQARRLSPWPLTL